MVKTQITTASGAGADRSLRGPKIRSFELTKMFFALVFLVAAVFAAMVANTPNAIAGDVSTEIVNTIVDPVQAESGDNVTVSARVICPSTVDGGGGTDHDGCLNTGDAVDAGDGTVTFEAYLPVSTTSCDSTGATLIPLGTDVSASDPWSVSFTPDGVGLVDGNVYFLRIVYSGDPVGAHGTNGSSLDTGCAALATLVVEDPLVEKVLVSGPSDDTGADVISTPPSPNTNDDGIIWIGLEEPQYFVFEIIIDNDEGIPLIVSDVVGADFDIDNRDFHDVTSDSGDCVVRLSQPPNSDNSPKEPEFIDIDVAIDAVCTIEVHIVTVENPGGGNNLFEPTGTRIVGQTAQGSPVDIFDTYTLNEGVKVFDASDSANSGERIIGPVGSLQLTPIPAP